MEMRHLLVIGLMMAGLGLPAHADSIAARQRVQNARVREGVRSGSLTPAETARLRAEQAQLRRQVVRNRIDGGELTPAERARIHANAKQNSRAIARLKHNGRTR